MLLTQLQHQHQHHRPHSPQHTQIGHLTGQNGGGGGSLSSPTQTTSSSNLSSRSNNSQSSSPVSSTDLSTSSCLLKDADADEDYNDNGVDTDDAMMTPISPASAHSTDREREREEDGGGFSALQRLQFALEKNSLFSGVFANAREGQSNPHSQRSPSKKQRSRSVRKLSRDVNYREDDEDKMLIERHNLTMNTNAGALTHTHAQAAEVISLEPAIPDNIFQCPLCSITCNERHSFNEHLVTHTQQSGCPKCDFITNDPNELKEHVLAVHGLPSIDGVAEDDEVPVPKVNAQSSKGKKFKCKTCDHVSITKTEFWAHTKSHIKQDKMLQCPKCPFVTEYKHHLEYHLRNHTGSKPFQCSHCAYSCVNKSMLASHLKSHSTIYQYRCADCDYATKYCHSLKMHLRKHGHAPQMVLNPDGTPNPLPIIDVYGTRRGPKLKKPNYSLIPITQLQVKTKKVNKTPPRSRKPKKESETRNGPKEPNNNNIPSISQPTLPQDDKKQQQPLQIPKPRVRQPDPAKASPQMQKMERTQTPDRQAPPQHQHHTPTSTMLQGLLLQSTNPYLNQKQTHAQPVIQEKQKQPKPQPVNGYVNNNNIINFPAGTGTGAPATLPKNMLELYASALNQYLLANNPVLFHQLLANNGAGLGGGAAFSGFPMPGMQNMNLSPLSSPNSHSAKFDQGHGHGHGAALDLSSVSVSRNGHNKQMDMESPPPNNNSRKRTRKGRALRFDRTQLLQLQSEDSDDALNRFDDETVLDFSNATLANNNNNNHSPVHKVNGRDHAHASDLSKCKYCDISFPDQFLYKMHMSYHYFGDSEPFLCKCGTKTKDKVAFFIHLTTEPH